MSMTQSIEAQAVPATRLTQRRPHLLDVDDLEDADVVRLLRRAEPMSWQEVSILPFLARNAYLAQIDIQQTEEFFATRYQGGCYTPSETLQQMCWNLLVWVKKRLLNSMSL